jgi:hypothetical protein
MEKYEKENIKLSADLPVLQEIAKSTWRKEDELKQLKSELTALNRKNDLSLKPIDTSEDKPTEKQVQFDNTRLTIEQIDVPDKKVDDFIKSIQDKYDTLPDKENYLIAFHGGRRFDKFDPAYFNTGAFSNLDHRRIAESSGERIDNAFVFSYPTEEMNLTQTFYSAINRFALPYGGQDPAVKAVFIHKSITDNSNVCEGETCVKFEDLGKLIYAGDLLAKKEVLKERSDIEVIQDLMSGKLDNIKDMKEAMGDRLVIATVPKHENDRKGFKL